ncbi:MAG: N-acetyl-gamma-glutamyl-phosphate reductase [Actinomycetes bacterium]
MSQLAAVVGASGYTGGELLRLLASHPALSVGPVFGSSSAGRTLGSVHRNLPRLASTLIGSIDDVVTDPRSAIGHVDVVFLALPHGHSGRLARAVLAAMPDDHPVLIDLGADHRLQSSDDWDRYYGPDADSHAGTWTYGLPELRDARAAISAARLIANPGCYPTAVVLALAPLMAADLADADDVVVVAASGTSGAGRSPSTQLLGSEVMGSLSAYKAGGAHQHTPEMAQALARVAGSLVHLSFTPVLAPMPRGILATCTARAAPDVTAEDARQALIDAYHNEPFVNVLEPGVWPRTADVLGSNSAHIQVAVDELSGRVVAVSAIDNLIKGAAGQAVQNANLALRIGEQTGLTADGIAP